ncbi:hypothetical protein [Tuwongella immobilis]|uniref:Uncharacterized protein n=1 Tax=Tuwongella immobilis TaxID=692036 RepID=A0A6C2YN87_9BACT|nr:hypothetical protein [Tuwongella immobilis]VIP03080.1 unnamed protein product [Tuwongella immobilis]VTS03327.1 unnamed protein product [Tuwongella immobilis]
MVVPNESELMMASLGYQKLMHALQGFVTVVHRLNLPTLSIKPVRDTDRLVVRFNGESMVVIPVFYQPRSSVPNPTPWLELRWVPSDDRGEPLRNADGTSPWVDAVIVDADGKYRTQDDSPTYNLAKDPFPLLGLLLRHTLDE